MLESLVIVDQHATVKSAVGFVHTARRTPKAALRKASYTYYLSFYLVGTCVCLGSN